MGDFKSSFGTPTRLRPRRAAWSALALALLGAGAAIAQQDSVDVSSYPPEAQRDYQVFAAKCSRCHALSRPLRASYRTDRQWQDVITRMARLPGAGLSREDQAASVRFLV